MWMVEDAESGPEGWGLCYFIGRFLAFHGGPDIARHMLLAFDTGDAAYRGVLGKFALIHLDWLRTDDLSPDRLSWLVSNLRHGVIGEFGNSLLGRIATEPFVEGQPLPLIPEAEGPMRSNLIKY